MEQGLGPLPASPFHWVDAWVPQCIARWQSPTMSCGGCRARWAWQGRRPRSLALGMGLGPVPVWRTACNTQKNMSRYACADLVPLRMKWARFLLLEWWCDSPSFKSAPAQARATRNIPLASSPLDLGWNKTSA